MKKIIDRTVSKPSDYSLDEPLYVHACEENNAAIVLFVHGLGGSIYGRNSTWEKFPANLLEDLSGFDIGLYQYRTLTGRLGFGKSIRLEKEAKVFADTIRDDLEGYNNVVLLGHSMGGILCKAVISQLIRNNDQVTLETISGLFLLATPQLGSLRVLEWLPWFFNDAKVLKAHNHFLTDISDTLSNHLLTKEGIDATIKTTIPTWAVLGASDFWVDELSAGVGISSDQKKITRGTHKSIVKPKSKDQPEYSWIVNRLSKCKKQYRYDVFVAAVMAGHSSDDTYKESRLEVLAISDHLEKKGLKKVYYAGKKLESANDFEPKSLALEADLDALICSRYFLLYYPDKVVSSVLYEAGIALAHGKPSVYFVTDRDHLPFLMQQSGQANIKPGVRIFQADNIDQVVQRIDSHGEELWKKANL